MRRRWSLLLRGMEEDDADLVEDRGRLLLVGVLMLPLLLAWTPVVVAARTSSPKAIDVNPNPYRGWDVRGRTGMLRE
jgi:hypothetical protein